MLRSRKAQNVINGIFVFVVLLGIAMVFFVSAFSKTDLMSNADEELAEIVPVRKVFKDSNAPLGYKYDYSFKYHNEEYKVQNLGFYSIHSNVDVYVENRRIYSFRNNGGIGKTPGSMMHMVELFDQYDGKTVRVEIMPVYDENAKYVPVFYQGSKLQMVQVQFRHDSLPFVLSLILINLGIFYLIFAMIQKRNKQSSAGLEYLGAFALLLAIWCIGDLRFTGILLSEKVKVLSAMSLLSEFLAPVALMLFIRDYSDIEVKKYANFAVSIMYVLVTSNILSQLFNVMDLRENLVMLYVEIILIAMIAVTNAIRILKSDKTFEFKARFVVFVLLIFGCVGLDVARFNSVDSSHDLIFTIIGFTFFVAYIGAGRMAELYHKANTDTMTRLFNNSRVNELLARTSKASYYSGVAVFDLNGLKHINDTLGHIYGDEMIKIFADMLKANVPGSAFIGRFGGDEFMFVLRNADNERMEKILENIAHSASTHNEKSDIKISYAVGYACNGETKMTLQQLFDEADDKMYSDKQEHYSDVMRK